MTKDASEPELALLVQPPTKLYLIKNQILLLVSSLFFILLALLSLAYIAVFFVWPTNIESYITGGLFVGATFLYIIPGTLGILTILIKHKVVTTMYVISIMIVSVIHIIIFMVYMTVGQVLGLGVFSASFLVVLGCCFCQVILGHEFNGVIFEIKIMNSGSTE